MGQHAASPGIDDLQPPSTPEIFRGRPLTQDRVIAIGRLGGPHFLDSEIARLHHLAALVK